MRFLINIVIGAVKHEAARTCSSQMLNPINISADDIVWKKRVIYFAAPGTFLCRSSSTSLSAW